MFKNTDPVAIRFKMWNKNSWLNLWVGILSLYTVLNLAVICTATEEMDGNKKKNISAIEANLIAMDFTGDLLPPQNLSAQISCDLAEIRNSFPDVRNLTYRGRWHAGELLTEVNLTKEQKQRINESEYGPLLHVGRSDEANLTLMMFAQMYNPEKLSQIMKTQFGLECQPFLRKTPFIITYGYNDDARAESHEHSNPNHSGDSNRKYTFERRSGGCSNQEPSSCKKRHFWVFMFSENGKPTLENEYDAPKNRYTLVTH